MTTISLNPAMPADVQLQAGLQFGLPFTPQVQGWLEAAASQLKGVEAEIILPGQGVAACLLVPALEGFTGFRLPLITLHGFGQQSERQGNLDLADFRHNEVRSRRGERSDGEAYPGYTVLDAGGRGMEEHQLSELAAILATTTDNIRVVSVPVGQVDPAMPQKGMVDALLSSPLTKGDWESGRIVYLPPGFGLAGAVQATAIYGLSEVWPLVIRLNRGSDNLFHVDEVVDPHAMRQWGATLAERVEADFSQRTLQEMVVAINGPRRRRKVQAEAKGSTLTFMVDGQKYQVVVTAAKKL